MGLELSASNRLTHQLAPAVQQSIKLLAMNIPQLREAIVNEMSRNPVIEDIDHSLERPLEDVKAQSERRAAAAEMLTPEDEAMPDVNADEDAAERRQRFFDGQVKEETLEEHLKGQLSCDIPEGDRALAEMLIGNLNDDGYFIGSMADIEMVSGANEARMVETLGKIMQLDPPGCGARNLKECLLAQMPKLEDSPYAEEVRKLIEDHLEDIAARREGRIESALGITRREYAAALRELRTLDPKPGRAFEGTGNPNRIVKPEVHLANVDGKWVAEVDDRSLPEIRISPKYQAMLEDPKVKAEDKEYIRERMASAMALVEAVEHREETVRKVAQAIVDAQPGFFEKGVAGLKPLTMNEVAEKTGICISTVSRTVNDKYISTPKGTVELRRFFVQGTMTDGGEVVATDAVKEAVAEMIAKEDKAKPLSDEAIAQGLKARGMQVARRTVAKYRGMLGIEGTSKRRRRG